jgi:predicted transcriptional regulator of viral defense system
MTTKIEVLLLAAPQTVFTIDDLGIFWMMPDRHNVARLANYYVRKGRLHSVRRGVYTVKKNYSPLEAAIKIFPPSYISFTTALAHHGAFFQYEQDIHLMALTSKTVTLSNEQVFVYHQIKDEVLLNQEGVEETDGYWMASLERAICDTSYLVSSFAFEHIDRANPDKLIALSSIYKSQALVGRMEKLAEIIIRSREGETSDA